MSEQRDLGVTLVGASLLMLSMVYLAQCSSNTPPPDPASQPSAAARSAERQVEPGSMEKSDDEESERVKAIGHALQTIGADPELRKTYGFNQ